MWRRTSVRPDSIARFVPRERRWRNSTFGTLAVLGVAWLTAAPASGCSMTGIATPEQLVQDAESIVRAKAVRYETQAVFHDDGFWEEGVVEFEVLETLKGADLGPQLLVRGHLTFEDDANDRRAPYTFVRPQGRSGSCFAYAYRGGAEFLLFLRHVQGELSPYWSGLAPVNEQLRRYGPHPWVEWVRKQLSSAASGAPAPSGAEP